MADCTATGLKSMPRCAWFFTFGAAPLAMPVRRPNSALRAREYLTAAEVAKLVARRASALDTVSAIARLILMAYRKNGTPSTHPMQSDELRSLRQLL
jgi:hypothetical protein